MNKQTNERTNETAIELTLEELLERGFVCDAEWDCESGGTGLVKIATNTYICADCAEKAEAAQ